MQRGCVGVDMTLLWLLWPAIASGRGALYFPLTAKAASGVLASVLTLYTSAFALGHHPQLLAQTLDAAGISTYPQKRTFIIGALIDYFAARKDFPAHLLCRPGKK